MQQTDIFKLRSPQVPLRQQGHLLLRGSLTLPKHTPSMCEKGDMPTCALAVVAAVSFSSSSPQSWEKMKSVRPMSWDSSLQAMT